MRDGSPQLPFEVFLERESAIVVVRVSGVLTKADFDDYASALRRESGMARRRAGRLMILVDATYGGLLPAETAGAVDALQNELASEPLDRIAILVTSSLQKLQVRRLDAGGKTLPFLSENAARTWLSAYSEISGAA